MKPQDKTKFEDVTIQTGTFEGIPITTTITAEDQKEAIKHGITLSDLIDLEMGQRDWQCDC